VGQEIGKMAISKNEKSKRKRAKKIQSTEAIAYAYMYRN